MVYSLSLSSLMFNNFTFKFSLVHAGLISWSTHLQSFIHHSTFPLPLSASLTNLVLEVMSNHTQ